MGMRTRSKSSISGRPARLIEWILYGLAMAQRRTARAATRPRSSRWSRSTVPSGSVADTNPLPMFWSSSSAALIKSLSVANRALAVPIRLSVVALDDPFHLRSSGLSSAPDDTRVRERFGCFKSSRAYLSTGSDAAGSRSIHRARTSLARPAAASDAPPIRPVGVWPVSFRACHTDPSCVTHWPL